MTGQNYGLIESLDELDNFLDRLGDGDDPIGLDIETGYLGADRKKASVRAELAMVVGISFSCDPSWARYVPLAHDSGVNLDNREVARRFWPVCTSGRVVAHNVNFEQRMLSRWFVRYLADDPLFGADVRASNGYWHARSCTQVEAYLAAEYESFGLKPLVKAMYGHQMMDLYELFEKFTDLKVNRRPYLRFNVLDQHHPEVYNYACEDAAWCLRIHQDYHPRISQMPLYPVEMAVIEECIEPMEDGGIKYDWPGMRRAADELAVFKDKYNAEIMAELSDMLGEPTAINLASPPQLNKLLYGRLGYRTSVYTAKTRDLPAEERKMSTGKIAMAGLAKKYPIVDRIRRWKEMTRLLGTYLEKYETLYQWADDGMAHPNHLNAFVITGRFAVSDPPYQQCVPGSYQVLTPHGWTRLDELPDGVPVAQYHDSMRIDFVVPEVVRNQYDGPMVELRGAEAGTWCYTPNHRIVYRLRQPRGDRVLGPVKECTAAEWADRLLAKNLTFQGRRFSDRYIPAAGYTTATEMPSESQIRSLILAVAVQADGSRTNGNQYDIIVYKDRKLAALRQLGLDPQQQSNGRWRVRVSVSAVAEWLDDTKNFRPEAILRQPQQLLRAFIDEVMQWDGDATRGATYGQKNTRRRSVEVVQAAATLCGYATSIYERPEHDAVTVNIARRPNRGAGWQDIGEVTADGMVFCVTVPTGMFVCRNDDGNVQVTGNSPKKYHYDLAEGARAHEEGRQPPPGTCFQFNFRDMITSPDGWYIVGFDLSQAELRAIAGEAKEPELLRAFAEGRDVHTLTASLMLGVPVDEVTPKQRDSGKLLGFALLYGLSPKGLADRLGITIEEAEDLFGKYFAVYSRIKAWCDKQVQFGQTHGYVVSRFGRRLPIWEYRSDKRYIRQKGDRACVNYPIQGSATGCYMRIAMVRAVRALKKAGLHDKVRLAMNVHDALELYVHKSVTPQQVIEVLQPAVIFPVAGWPSMQADWHIGRRWGSPVEIVYVDGKVRRKGEQLVEIKPGIEETEDGEEQEILPELTAEDVREVLAAAPADRKGRHLLVELAAMPTGDAWRRFLDMNAQTPGVNTVTVRTPHGDIDLDGTSGLDLDHLAAVSLLLGPVKLSFDADDTLHTMFDGLPL